MISKISLIDILLFGICVFIICVGVAIGYFIGLNQYKPEATIQAVEGSITEGYRIWVEVEGMSTSDSYILHIDTKDIDNAIENYKINGKYIPTTKDKIKETDY